AARRPAFSRRQTEIPGRCRRVGAVSMARFSSGGTAKSRARTARSRRPGASATMRHLPRSAVVVIVDDEPIFVSCRGAFWRRITAFSKRQTAGEGGVVDTLVSRGDA